MHTASCRVQIPYCNAATSSNSCNRTDAITRLVPTSLAFHRRDLSTNPIFTQWQDQLLEQFFA